LAIAGAVVLALALAYLAARTTPLFAVKKIEVRGAAPEASADVQTAVSRFLGTSLVALDGDDLIRRVESLPTVVSAGMRWLVSERGRVMRRAEEGEGRRFPHIEIEGTQAPVLGEMLDDPAVLVPLAALARVEKDFPARIRLAALTEGGLILTLGDETEVRLGEPADVEVKLAAAASVLSALSAEERGALAYLDVSLPERPVAAANPQVVG
jgi:cell division septal protein FtsQ